jgi:hypothetical protein
MFIIIDENYKAYQADILTGPLRSAVRRGELTLIEIRKDLKTKKNIVRGMNRSSWHEEIGEYSEIQKWKNEFLNAS